MLPGTAAFAAVAGLLEKPDSGSRGMASSRPVKPFVRTHLVAHTLLRPFESKYADVDRALEGTIDISDRNQHQRDEQGESKYLERVQGGVGRTKHGSRGYCHCP